MAGMWNKVRVGDVVEIVIPETALLLAGKTIESTVTSVTSTAGGQVRLEAEDGRSYVEQPNQPLRIVERPAGTELHALGLNESWACMRRDIGTPAETWMLRRKPEFEARYEISWKQDTLTVQAIRWLTDTDWRQGGYAYIAGRLVFQDGDPDTIPAGDLDDVLDFMAAEWNRE